MNREYVWMAMSYAWTEIGIVGSEYEDYAHKIAAHESEMGEFKRAVFFEIIPAFAVDTIFAFTFIGINLPDWSFDSDYLNNKVNKWLKRPLVLSLLNPIWLIGYPLAIIISFAQYVKLRKAVIKWQNLIANC